MNSLRNRPVLAIGAVLALVALGAVGWYLGSPLFIDNTVEEAFPFEVPSQDEMAGMSAAEQAALERDFMAALPDDEEIMALTDSQRDAVEEKAMAAAAMMPDHEMDEAMPAEADPVVRFSGTFLGADSFHQGAGRAAIYELPDGSAVLRFDDFSVTNGPDLHVILSTHPNPLTRDDVMAGYLDLGSLKGNKGSQNYDIPAGTDLSAYQSVVIYCQPFHVIFATAGLS